MKYGHIQNAQHSNTVPHYSVVRVDTTSDSQLQNTVTSHYSAVRIRATLGSRTLTPHYGSVRSRTPSGSLVYHRLFPLSGLSYSRCDTCNTHYFSNSWLLAFSS
jgi:hypothetical protein